jgi:hypothetical protein
VAPRALVAARDKGRLQLTELPIDTVARRLAEQVSQFNAAAAHCEVRGCLPPRFRRVFTGDWLLGGRWYACGSDGVYQQLTERERLGITIDGEAVAEVDAQASHLSIMHGLMGLPLANGYPYAIDGVPRSVAKRWIVATLGKGYSVTRWADRTPAGIAATDARAVGEAVLRRYAFLTSPWIIATHLSAFGPARALVTHRLMSVEAEALTAAMMSLAERGILALPMHDGLIVKGSAIDAAREAMAGAFQSVAVVQPPLSVEGPAQGGCTASKSRRW